MSVSEKAVLRVSDLLDWITNPSDIEWDRGILGVCHDDCVNSSNSKGLSAKKDKSTTNGGIWYTSKATRIYPGMEMKIINEFGYFVK
mgnify:CR=1 FL=1